MGGGEGEIGVIDAIQGGESVIVEGKELVGREIIEPFWSLCRLCVPENRFCFCYFLLLSSRGLKGGETEMVHCGG